jgi:1,4-dihydroxy-2-naphthoate octaprenyltransferase
MTFPRILRIIRVHIVVGGVLAFSLGALLAIAAGGSFDPVRFALYYVIVFLGDLSTHYSNDYFDVEVDKNAEGKKHFSGSHILVHNPQLRPLARSLATTFLMLSSALVVLAVLFQTAPIEILVIMLGANFLGLAYSAPPLRLVSRGLGEIAIAVATGFAIPAMGYLSVMGRLDSLFLWLAFPFVMYGLMLSLSLEAPDREIDLKGGKSNIAVRKGEKTVFSLISAAASSATAAFVFLAWLVATTLVDFRVVILFSLVPLTSGILGYASVRQRREVQRYSALNVASLFAFNMLMVAYLLAVTFTY